jgi:hypothetical protein
LDGCSAFSRLHTNITLLKRITQLRTRLTLSSGDKGGEAAQGAVVAIKPNEPSLSRHAGDVVSVHVFTL